MEKDLLGRSAAHQRDEPRPQIGLGREVIVLLAADGDAERLAMGEQGDLLDLPLVAVEAATDRMTDLVSGDDRSLALVHRATPGGPDSDLQPAAVQILGADVVGTPAGGEDGGLVQQVGEHRAREAVGLAGGLLEVNRLADRLVPGMNGKDLGPTFDVRQADMDLAVEPTGTEHR